MSSNVKFTVLITYIIMIVVNILSNAIPLNGVTAGEVSDTYANLFAPAGYTFAIWGLIYILLGLYTFYQLGIINKKDRVSPKLLDRVGVLFSISNIANALWIFAWHYYMIYIALILMLVILVCLIIINGYTKKARLTPKQTFFIRVPFSVYFGWITVATIANVTVWLVSLGVKAFTPVAVIVTAVVIVIGAIIAIFTILKNKDFVYGLVILWAYIGILAKHVSPKGFNAMYPVVITTVIVCLVVVTAVDIYMLLKKEY